MQNVVTPTPPPVSSPPTPVPPAPAQPAGITPEQLNEITTARHRSRKISRAAAVAAFSGWTLAFFAACSLLGGLFSLRAFVLGVGLCFVAYVEIKGSKGLRALDLSAPRRLALNQVGLVALITLYAGWGIYQAMHAPSEYEEYIAMGGQMADMLQPIDDMTRAVTIAVGIALIIGSMCAQAGAAVYYITRRGHIERFLRATPSWVVEAIKA